MCARRQNQPLSYDPRLPDEAQADALRLLAASQEVINAALVVLWPQLGSFRQEREQPSWKQGEDEIVFVGMQNVVEQACNHFCSEMRPQPSCLSSGVKGAFLIGAEASGMLGTDT